MSAPRCTPAAATPRRLDAVTARCATIVASAAYQARLAAGLRLRAIDGAVLGWPMALAAVRRRARSEAA